MTGLECRIDCCRARDQYSGDREDKNAQAPLCNRTTAPASRHVRTIISMTSPLSSMARQIHRWRHLDSCSKCGRHGRVVDPADRNYVSLVGQAQSLHPRSEPRVTFDIPRQRIHVRWSQLVIEEAESCSSVQPRSVMMRPPDARPAPLARGKAGSSPCRWKWRARRRLGGKPCPR